MGRIRNRYRNERNFESRKRERGHRGLRSKVNERKIESTRCFSASRRGRMRLMAQRQVNEITLLIRVLQRSSGLQQFRKEHVETAGRQNRQRRALRADERNERRSSHEEEEDGNDGVGE
jgi:hypothetical protein